MIIGRIRKNEESVRMDIRIRCSSCHKSVPGGVKASKRYAATGEFEREISQLRKTYLCGVCRDKKRVGDNRGA